MPSPGKTLSIIRVLIGTGAWVAPGLTGKTFGLPVEPDSSTPYFARLFGVRDVALAAMATQATGSSKRLAWQIGIACDVLDAGAAFLGGRNGSLPRSSAIMVGATATAAAGLGIAALQAGE